MVMLSPVSTPKRSASSASRPATRPMLSMEANSARFRSASRSLPLTTRRRAIAARGWRSRKELNSAVGIASASTGSIATAVAERGSSSIADISPNTSPGPRTASIASWPSSVVDVSLTLPAWRIITRSDLTLVKESGAAIEAAKDTPAAQVCVLRLTQSRQEVGLGWLQRILLSSRTYLHTRAGAKGRA